MYLIQEPLINKQLVGIDEAGRGPLAGPIFAAAVILDEAIDGVTDSKLLSKKKRELLFDLIYQKAIAVGVGYADNDFIDIYGLTKATSFAMEMALNMIKDNYDEIIIDGNYDYLPNKNNVKTVIKADLYYPCVSAASIIAKVSRDRVMGKYHKQYPEYSFDIHSGYPTKLHRLAISKYGPSPIHRKTFKLF
jgi:ribonuclease HII